MLLVDCPETVAMYFFRYWTTVHLPAPPLTRAAWAQQKALASEHATALPLLFLALLEGRKTTWTTLNLWRNSFARKKRKATAVIWVKYLWCPHCVHMISYVPSYVHSSNVEAYLEDVRLTLHQGVQSRPLRHTAQPSGTTTAQWGTTLRAWGSSSTNRLVAHRLPLPTKTKLSWDPNKLLRRWALFFLFI